MPMDSDDLALIEHYQQTRDPRVGDAILRRYERWCQSEARRAAYKFGIAFDDVLQAARLGLMDAVERCELGRETGLMAYASSWVRKRVADLRVEAVGGKSTHILDIRRRIGHAARQLRAEGAVVTDETIAARIGVGVGVVTAAQRREVSMDAPIGEDAGTTMHDVIADKASRRPDRVVEEKLNQERLRQALHCAIGTSLTERNAEIMRAFLDADCEMGAQTEIAMKLGVTRQRVSLAVAQAMPKLERALRLNGYGPGRAREMGE